MGGIRVEIGANTTALNRGLKQSKNRIAAWARSVVGRFARAGVDAARAFARGVVLNIKRVGMVAGGLMAAGIVKSVSEAGRFEQYEMQFEALLGSVEAAKSRMDEIKAVDLEAPFDITEIAVASKMLTVFTANAFAGTDALKMMADAASVTPRPLSEIAYWYGRAYSMIKANRPLGEAVMRLTEMGLISDEASIKLQRLSKSYSPRAQAMKLDLINQEFRKFEGSAAKLVETWPGLMSVFSSATKQAFAAVGDSILPLAKIWLQEVIDTMTELRDNGTLARWGENVATAAAKVRKAMEDHAIPAFKRFLDAAKKYLGEYQTFLDDGDWSGAFRKATSDGVEAAINALKAHGPEFYAIGVELGAAIAHGISDAVDKSMRSSWIGRRLADSVDLVTGKSYGDMIKAKDQEDASQRAFNEMNPSQAVKPKLRMHHIPGQVGETLQSIFNPSSNPNRNRFGTSAEPVHVVIDNPTGGQ